MKKHATLKDIAKALNISTATVSRALADRLDVNPKTKKLVIEESKRQNYKPNPIALRLQNKRSKTIGLVIPEFKTGFFPNVISGIQKVLTENDYQLIITSSEESSEVEEINLRLLENNMVEGIIMSITREGVNSDYYQRIINSGIPIVFFNRFCSNVVASKVIIDDYKMAFFATEHLIYNKFKKIIHFSGPKNISVANKRKQGFLDAMKKHHKEITDAIFCFNDPTAFGALRALKEAGFSCPKDVALVGFSETEVAQLIEPSLTSVEQPTFEIGETAAKLLLKQILITPAPEVETICLSAKLNIRNSSTNLNIEEILTS
jgi:DNA-binding LacI/PurR family transcriptional regulator